MGVRGEDVKDEVSVDGEIGDVQMNEGDVLRGARLADALHFHGAAVGRGQCYKRGKGKLV